MSRPSFDQMLPLGATSGVGAIPDGPLPAPDWLKGSIQAGAGTGDLSSKVSETKVPQVRKLPGFKGYYLIDDGTGATSSFGITDESNRVASPQSSWSIRLEVPAEDAAKRWRGIEGVLRLAGNEPLNVEFKPEGQDRSYLWLQTTPEQFDRLDLDALKGLLEAED
jgi:hypothetical protein